MKKIWVSEYAKAGAELERKGAYGKAGALWIKAEDDSVTPLQKRYCRQRQEYCRIAVARGWGQ